MSNNIESHKTGRIAKLEKNTNSIGLVVLTSLFIFSITCFTVMGLASQTSTVSSILPTGFAQRTQGEGPESFLSSSSLTSITLSSVSSSSSSSSLASDSDDFRLSYSKLAVSNGSYIRILYDSKTSSLRLTNISTTSNDDERGRLSLSQQLSQHQSNKQISDSDSSDLRRMINNSAFFQSDSTYPPSNKSAKDSYDAVYVLTIDVDDNLHTVIWTDDSENIPVSLMSIAKTIEKIYSR